MGAEVRVVPAAEVLAADLAGTYRAAFTGEPWNESPEQADAFVRRLPEFAAKPGFRAALAVDGDTVVGFCLGCTTPTPFPARGGAYGHVKLILGPAAEELCGTFELYELAVDPAYARLGLGSALVEATVPDGPAWLLTLIKADRARAFYERLGWRELGADYGIVVYART